MGGGGGGGSGLGEGAGWNDGAVVVVLVADGAVRAGFEVPWPDAGCERRCGAGSERGSDGRAPRERKPGLSHAAVSAASEQTTRRRGLRQVIFR